jgi:alpha-glucosidase
MSVAGSLERAGALLDEPHHDGSANYVLERPDELGAEATVRLRVPHGSRPERVVLNYDQDGEPRNVAAIVDEETETETWWRASFPAWNPSVRYRWLLSGDGAGYAWVNAMGVAAHDVADADDFVLPVGDTGPEWHLSSVVYEIFPDRFASSGGDADAPPWAVRREWDELPTGRGPATPVELFGGDLRGIEQRLDHVESLGANLIYLTPFFPAGSTHRYDASSFGHVDPLLGGDEALASLSRAAHARGIRTIGDLTLNHSGKGHEWFQTAVADSGAPERSFYYFDDALPNGYESWLGVPSLPKLDWRSEELRRRMGSVTRRYLEPPFDLDGWRIDVANMVGRFRGLDLNRDVSRWARREVGSGLLLAEHGHDFRSDLDPHGWHGVMNYSGFLRPLWTWLRRDDPEREQRRQFWGVPVPVPRLGGVEAVEAMRRFRAGISWEAVLHSWSLLDSHDTARFRTITGSRERQLVGIGMQATTPGVPMLFAGDELGLEGAWGEDARRTMPWSRPETWDEELLAGVRRLVALRRSSEALTRGGIRYAHVGADAIAYLREAPGERLLCLAARAAHKPIRLSLAGLGTPRLDTLEGGDAALEDGEAILPGDGPAFSIWRLEEVARRG